MGAGVDDATAKIIEGTGISSTQLQSWGSEPLQKVGQPEKMP